MMSESVTVTVQNGDQAGRPGPGLQPVNFTVNTPYFRTLPGLAKIAQMEENSKETGTEKGSSKAEEEPEKTEEELMLEEKRRTEWEKLNNFLKSCVDEMIDAVALNATINSYTNDVVNLDKDESPRVPAISCQDYEEKVSLIDLKTIGGRYIFSVSWHGELDDILICTYLDNEVESCSLIALWSLHIPLHPKMILNCEEKVSTLSFCPIQNYCDIAIGGCLGGEIVVWEINRDSLLEMKEEDIEEKDVILTVPSFQQPPTCDAKIASSSAKSQKLSITSIQWLPTWCYIGTDGNFQKVSPNSVKEPKPYFATSSTDGSIFFWSLPRTLASPAKIRSPLHLTIAPIYQLYFDKVNTCILMTCFCLPLAKTEDTSSLNIRDQSDLGRLRKVFVGTSSGEVVSCTWEGQTFSVDAVDSEVCRIQTRCQVHDGAVKTMVKSPHLDDMFLTVGGRVFAVWKEDFAEEPLFYRRSKECQYGSGCWSERSGIIVLTRLDGCFEVWDLKRKAHEPVLMQTVSEKVTPYIYPSPPTSGSKLLAVVEGSSNLRIFVEPNESRKDEDLERIEWFEEFAWRETKRKLDFNRWQGEYLSQHPVALRRKTEREQAEVKRRHQEAREKFLKILGIICIALGSGHGFAAGWFLFVAISTFILSVLWSFMYLFSVREALKIPVNWIVTELLNTGVYAVLYFTAFIVILAGFQSGAHIAAGIFGMLNTLAYAVGAYFLYLEQQNGQ